MYSRFTDALPTANFQSFVQGMAIFDYISSISPDFPLMNMEFWVGWFDHWGEPTQHGHSSVEGILSLKITEDIGTCL